MNCKFIHCGHGCFAEAIPERRFNKSNGGSFFTYRYRVTCCCCGRSFQGYKYYDLITLAINEGFTVKDCELFVNA